MDHEGRECDSREEDGLESRVLEWANQHARTDSYIKSLHMGPLHETKAWSDLIWVSYLVGK